MGCRPRRVVEEGRCYTGRVLINYAMAARPVKLKALSLKGLSKVSLVVRLADLALLV
ncbi:hypothetical protein [Rubritalea tangerina]|uniref:hypothetical protein n=1 Tax=Rubritalea tangerina TaxID=430798 RepID=UPI003621566E